MRKYAGAEVLWFAQPPLGNWGAIPIPNQFNDSFRDPDLACPWVRVSYRLFAWYSSKIPLGSV